MERPPDAGGLKLGCFRHPGDPEGVLARATLSRTLAICHMWL